MATVVPPVAATGSAASPVAEQRDMWGFPVKQEYSRIYQRFAPIFAAEEAERSERWLELIAEVEALLPSLPGEDEAALLRRLLSHLEATTVTQGGGGSVDPGAAAALLQRLASLVQAGLPMAKRGAFWRLFLNVDSKRREGEYARLAADAAALEEGVQAQQGAAAAGAGSGAGGLPGSTPPSAKAAADAGGAFGPYSLPGAVYSLVADASAGGQLAGQPPAVRHNRVETFSLTRLDDESPRNTPEKVAALGPQQAGAEGSGAAEAAQAAMPGAAAAPAAAAGAPEASAALSPQQAAVGTPLAPSAPAGALPPPPALLTPASTLQTPLSSSSRDTGCPSCGSGAPVATPTPAAACGGGGGEAAGAADRWRFQDFLAQIDKDLHRTFPGHPCMDAGGRAALRRILSAYARRNPAVGYCQGLNFLAATFLLFMGEEDAFWSLCALIEDVLGTAYFDEKMVPVQVDVLVFSHLLQGRFPTLWRHLQQLDVDAASVTMHWFLCCFLNSLPLDSTLRVWDCLFFEGSPVVLFRTALALVEIYNQPLMATAESSDVYMLLQACAQMTFDASRLVDTAACGYAHLRPTGLAALRQRYKGEVLQNLRGSLQSEAELEQFASGALPGMPPSGSQEDDSSQAPSSFADAFRRVVSALAEAEEAVARMQQQQGQAGSGGDGGHLSPARSRAGSSRRSSPASHGSQPASPLARVQHAVRGLTSRLMPSSLPMLLPAGAVGASGEELPTAAAGSTVSLRGGFGAARGPAALASAGAGRRQWAPAEAAGGAANAGAAEAQGPPTLRRISLGDRGGEASSPTAHLTGSAGAGAALGRHGSGRRLTPFSDFDASALAGPLQQLQLQQAGLAGTPQRPPRASSGLRPPLAAAGPPPVAQSQPATPTGHMLGVMQPPASQRRALTAGYPDGSQGHSRRRRRLTIDLLTLANLRPDLQQPAVAAAFAIAANPSPRAGSRGGGTPVLAPLAAPGSPLCPAGASCDGEPLDDSCGDELLLPIRALRFDEQEAGGLGGEGSLRGSGSGSSSEEQLAAADGAGEAPAGALGQNEPEAAPADSQAEAAGTAATAAPAGAASPTQSPARRQQHPLQAPALVAVVAQLQDEVAVAESRRHEAEQAAAAAQQTAADLRQQLNKVQQLVSTKEALVAELTGRLEASSAAVSELSGEIAANQLALEAEEAAGERRRRQAAAADALIRRLMDAVAQSRAQSPSKGSQQGSGTDSAGSAHTAASGSASLGASMHTASSGSPQSSSGSVGQQAWRGSDGSTPSRSISSL